MRAARSWSGECEKGAVGSPIRIQAVIVALMAPLPQFAV